MMSGNVDKGKISFRQGTSYARGAAIDLFLEDTEIVALYDKWKSDEWGEPLGFSGGIVAITCDMVSRVPLQSLVSAYGKKLAARLSEVAAKNQ